ncbi:hypothetical protein GCM10010106_25220 [Thermopolyspora flexuosa]|nr:hypothetical protein GCM10010106_25220 [Thermopolyspora flexuosa]
MDGRRFRASGITEPGLQADSSAVSLSEPRCFISLGAAPGRIEGGTEPAPRTPPEVRPQDRP